MRENCKVCRHPKRAQIDAKIANGDSISSLSKLYGISRTTLSKHRDECLVSLLAEDKETKDAIIGDSLINKVEKQIDLVQKMITACDEWLTDPDDPNKYYLGPRGDEVDVVYYEIDPETNRVGKQPRKSTLQEMMEAVEGAGYIIKGVSFNHADPRDLLLKAITKLEGTVKMIHSASQNLIEWQYKKEAMEKLSNAGDTNITFEKQIGMIAERITIATAKNDTSALMAKAGMPSPTKEKPKIEPVKKKK
jgi:hypothetical protein